MSNVDETLSFLARSWAENPRLRVVEGPGFASDPKESYITVPCFFGEDETAEELELHGFDRWRWWRFAVFHESQHDLRSPPDKVGFATEVVHEAGGVISTGPRKLMPHVKVAMRVVNLVEDYRIEKVGLRTYLGYVSEQEWRRKVAAKYWLGEKPEKMCLCEIDTILLDFQRSLLLEHPSDSLTVEMWSGMARGCETVPEVKEVAVNVMKYLLDKFDEEEFAKAMGPDLCEMFLVFVPGDAADVLKEHPELAGSPLLMVEWERVKSRLTEEAPDVDASMIQEEKLLEEELQMLSVRPVSDAPMPLPGSGDLAVQRLMTFLRRWRVGWVEVLNDKGDDIDPEEFILSRVTDEKHDKFFLDERLLSPKTDVALLVDMSGSIHDDNLTVPYLSAMAVIGHALNFIGTKFAMYAFDGADCEKEGRQKGSSFWVVKRLEERWDSGAINRLASLRGRGGTPLSRALRFVQFYQRIKRFKRVVVITDGRPDNARLSRRAAFDLLRSGVSVSMLAYRNTQKECNEALRTCAEIVGRRGRVCSICDLSGLPWAFFELVKA